MKDRVIGFLGCIVTLVVAAGCSSSDPGGAAPEAGGAGGGASGSASLDDDAGSSGAGRSGAAAAASGHSGVSEDDDGSTGGVDASGGSGTAGNAGSGPSSGGSGTGGEGVDPSSAGSAGSDTGPVITDDGLPPAGTETPVDVPTDALPEDTSTPDTVVGTGTPKSCTSERFVDAVWSGGIITFNCGSDPVTITLETTAEVNNVGAQDIVIDGGGLITLSGGGERRILYQNVCLERLGWATSDCWGQGFPRVTLQNLTFINGYAPDAEGGGAVHVSGGRLKVIRSRFFNNHAPFEGPDEGGGALRVQQIQAEPVYIVDSTFGGEGELGNSAANGGAISGLFTNYVLYNTVLMNNAATACCGNPATSGPGGGSGGGIYMDGLELELELHNVLLEGNSCRAHGSAIFFVSNDHAGLLTITDSNFRNNAEGEGNWYPEPDISMHEDTARTIESTVFE